MSGRVATVALAALGTAVSAYLTWVHYSGSLALCAGAGGCETVQASRYSMAGPVPVAVIGLVGLATITAVSAWRLDRAAPVWALTALFGLSLAATLYVAYLTYVELFVIRAVCPWCASVAMATVAVLVLTLSELRAVPQTHS
ncbi:MAG: vitamin K epoxide reductase family protein [Candidatus Limnocylindria bacterium]